MDPPSSRRRRPNFAASDVKVLIDGVRQRKYVALPKTHLTQPQKEAKEKAWDEITDAVNQISAVKREKEEVKRRWNVIKSTASRKKHLLSRKPVMSEVTLQITSDEEAVLEILEQLSSASPPKKEDAIEVSHNSPPVLNQDVTSDAKPEDAIEVSHNSPPVLNQDVTSDAKPVVEAPQPTEDAGEISQTNCTNDDTVPAEKEKDRVVSQKVLLLLSSYCNSESMSPEIAEDGGVVSQNTFPVLSECRNSDNSASSLQAGDIGESENNIPAVICKDENHNDTISSAKADDSGEPSSNIPLVLCEDCSDNVTVSSARAASIQKQDSYASIRSSLSELKKKQEQIADALEEVTNLMKEGLKEFHGMSATLNKLFDC